MPATRLPKTVRGISLDFANTLYPLNAPETAETIRHLHRFLERRLAKNLPADMLHELYCEIRERQFAENKQTLQENDFPGRIHEMISRVDAPPSDALVAEAIEAYADGFIDTMRLPDGMLDTVARLSDRFEGRVAVCSNFIIHRAIVEPLRRDGILPLLRGVVISCDIGFVKPHPLIFRTLCETLDLAPEEIVHVGDDLEADIFGGRRAGMCTVYTAQLRAPVSREMIADANPDFVVAHLSDLSDLANTSPAFFA